MPLLRLQGQAEDAHGQTHGAHAPGDRLRLHKSGNQDRARRSQAGVKRGAGKPAVRRQRLRGDGAPSQYEYEQQQQYQ